MEFGSTLESALKSASDGAKSLFNQMAETVNDGIELINNQVEDITEAVQETYQQTKEAVQETYQQTKEAVQETYQQTKEAVQETYQQTKEALVEAYDVTKQQVKTIAKKISNEIKEAKQKVSRYLAPKPAGTKIEFCPCRDKKERLAYRQNKIETAKNKLDEMESGPKRDALDKATTRFEFNNQAVERARLADSTYSIGQDDPPEGWNRPNVKELQELGLDPKLFPALDSAFIPEEHKDGFFVEIYKSDPSVFAEEKYVIAFRGTQGIVDWGANGKESIGLPSSHYTKAMYLVNDVKAKLGPQLEVTGHSLGGGLATAAGIVSGTKTYAFNPAGVHPNTLERAGPYSRDMAFDITEDGKTLVDNVVIPGEVVTGLQEKNVQQGVLAVSAAISPLLTLGTALLNRATREQGTLTYGMTGPRHEVPLLSNAKEVTAATAKGESIQGMTPSLAGSINASINPLKKIDMHSMDFIIAGIEQQKADDLGQLELNT